MGRDVWVSLTLASKLMISSFDSSSTGADEESIYFAFAYADEESI